MIALKHSTKIIKFFGEEATNTIIKIAGLLIIAVGIQLILSGLSNWLSINLLITV